MLEQNQKDLSNITINSEQERRGFTVEVVAIDKHTPKILKIFGEQVTAEAEKKYTGLQEPNGATQTEHNEYIATLDTLSMIMKAKKQLKEILDNPLDFDQRASFMVIIRDKEDKGQILGIAVQGIGHEDKTETLVSSDLSINGKIVRLTRATVVVRQTHRKQGLGGALMEQTFDQLKLARVTKFKAGLMPDSKEVFRHWIEQKKISGLHQISGDNYLIEL